MSGTPAAAELLRALAPVLDRFGGRWYVFGAQAVILWGRPRLTADVDVTAFLEPDEPLAFVAAMERAGFTSRVRDVDAFARATRGRMACIPACSLPASIASTTPSATSPTRWR